MPYNREELTCGVAERLKALRTEKNLSYAALAKMLQERYSVSIHPDTLKFYEVGLHHSKAYNNLGMKLEYLYILADFYQVSVDTLLGKDPYPLSDRAKARLSKLCNSSYRDTLNAMLDGSGMADILRTVMCSRINVTRRIAEVFKSENMDERRLGEIRYEARHLRRDIAEDIEKALEYVCNFHALDSAIKTKLKMLGENDAQTLEQEAHNGKRG